MNYVYLKELIEALEQMPPNAIVPNGFGEPMSYRGYYDQVAFEPIENARIGDMLEHARNALGKTFTGYKGGEFMMDETTECWIAEYGSGGTDMIGPTLLKLWATIAKEGEMSNVLIEKLRNGWHIFTHEDRIKAADELERLQAENSDLKQADANLRDLYNVALNDIRRYRELHSVTLAENADLTAKCNHIMTEHGKLLAEVEGLRKDAARLDYIIENCMTDGGGNGFTLTIKFNTDTECIKHAIDVAMASNP